MECSVVITGNYPSEPERKTESTVVFDLPNFAIEKRVNGNEEEVSCFGKACHFELERNAGQKALKFFSLFGRIGSMEEELEPPKSKKAAACALGRFSLWGSVLLFGVSASVFPFVRAREASYICYYLNWAHWPGWYAVNLWMVAAASLLLCLFRKRNPRRVIYAVTGTAIAVVFALNSVWLRALIQKLGNAGGSLFHDYFLPRFYPPLVDFMATGKVTKEFLVALGCAAVPIALLLFCRYLLRKHRSDFFRPPKERGSDEQR